MKPTREHSVTVIAGLKPYSRMYSKVKGLKYKKMGFVICIDIASQLVNVPILNLKHNRERFIGKANLKIYILRNYILDWRISTFRYVSN